MRLARLAMVMGVMGFAANAKAADFRREGAFDFGVEAAVQDRGGVQYFFVLQRAERQPLQQAPFTRVRPLLPAIFQRNQQLHALASRIVYTLDKDASFFTRERTLDVAFMNTILPDGRIEARPDGTFRANKLPANTLRIEFLDAEALQNPESVPGLSTFLALVSDLGTPESVVVQSNDEFDRVLGMQTAAFSVTWTGHFRVADGKTRVAIITLSLLHNIPPFFLGGEERVHEEAVAGARQLITQMRRYRD